MGKYKHLRSPCILFIDELETLCGRRETLNQESEKRIVSLFSNLIDEVIISLKRNTKSCHTHEKLDFFPILDTQSNTRKQIGFVCMSHASYPSKNSRVLFFPNASLILFP